MKDIWRSNGHTFHSAFCSKPLLSSRKFHTYTTHPPLPHVQVLQSNHLLTWKGRSGLSSPFHESFLFCTIANGTAGLWGMRPVRDNCHHTLLIHIPLYTTTLMHTVLQLTKVQSTLGYTFTDLDVTHCFALVYGSAPLKQRPVSVYVTERKTSWKAETLSRNVF